MTTKTKMTKAEREARKVHFAEEDVVLGFASSYDESEEDEATQYQSQVVDIRESMRDCVLSWSKTPYWQLLEGCVDDEEGEAKDVQKYITTFARIEIDGDCPRGLERQLCRSHHEARKAHYDAVTFAVLDADFRLRYESRGANKLSVDEIWGSLRHVYKELSRSSKALARKLGKADEAAVNRDTADNVQALFQIEELQERAMKGLLKVKRDPATSESKSRRQSSRDVRSSTSSAASTSSSSRKAKTGTLLGPLQLGQDSDHNPSSSKKDKDRKAPMRFPSLTAMHRKKEKDNNDNFVNNNGGDNAADLFLDVDKKGKTKSTWRSVKKGISKRVQATGAGVNQRVH